MTTEEYMDLVGFTALIIAGIMYIIIMFWIACRKASDFIQKSKIPADRIYTAKVKTYDSSNSDD